jgi:hypothetical protein
MSEKIIMAKVAQVSVVHLPAVYCRTLAAVRYAPRIDSFADIHAQLSGHHVASRRHCDRFRR